MKQEKVACLIDNDARLAVEPSDPFAIQTKPHGHGDVHGLLHRTGLARAWAASGLRWVTFFQDTNALVFRALLAALGVSATHSYAMNSIAVPRKARRGPPWSSALRCCCCCRERAERGGEGRSLPQAAPPRLIVPSAPLLRLLLPPALKPSRPPIPFLSLSPKPKTQNRPRRRSARSRSSPTPTAAG